MINKNQRVLLGLAAGVAVASNAPAAVVLVSSDITTSTTWTADNVYRLQNQIYVKNGATLTIEAGTLIASTTNVGGSLAVTRGSKIFVNGTQDDPVIMTSTADVATWAGGDPETGTWREAANEWGNLTIMGEAYISENIIAGNTPAPDPDNFAVMEGLVEDFVGDPDVRYGGGDDDDDSGSISFLSLRYGGKVIALTNELNGLSLGGIGRETDIHHIDIMNNVDDGVEVWGGTVNLKYLNVWNIGDDTFDFDQGWRGKAQFLLAVQGYSVNAAQGSGVGDNIFETDGAEQSDYQPVTTAAIYNATVIGQPLAGAGDHATAWRDNARVQYRNSIFMDLGERLVSFDNVDGDGGLGYGNGGTLSWANTWTTNFNAAPAHANDPANPSLFYTAQTSGKLAQITDSVMFRNLHASAYTEANNRGVFNAGNNNVLIPGFDPLDAPIVGITRNATDADSDGNPGVTRGGTFQLPVTSVDPRAANEAATSVGMAPDDGFFTPVQYRGAFSADENWLCGWTAADAFGFNGTPVKNCTEPALPCPTDINGDATTNVDDLLAVINGWGTSGDSDVNGDGTTNVDDLLEVINGWGGCP